MNFDLDSLINEVDLTSDFSVIKRQCNYGGHMVRINDTTFSKVDKTLISFKETCKKMGIKYLSNSNPDNSLESFNLQIIDEV